MNFLSRGKILFFLAAMLLPAAAFAQSSSYMRMQSGTGFFVNSQYIITNAHVVAGCRKATIHGAVTEGEVDVQVLDEQRDLALLKSTAAPPEFAPLRLNIDEMKAGDTVYVIGYPDPEGLQGQYKMVAAKVRSLPGKAMGGNPGQFYISDVVHHGNSGGPVFDTSGNVIGVVVAITSMNTINSETHAIMSEEQVGVVISLATVKDFLLAHGAYTQWGGSYLSLNQGDLENRAKHYIVNVQCLQPVAAKAQ